MVANLMTTTPYQDFLYEAEQCMIGTLNFDSVSPVVIGGLPAGAIVTGILFVTTTAFAGGTPVYGVGIINAAGVATPGYYVATGTTPPAVGVNAATLAATALPLASNSQVTVTLTGGATSGAAKVIVRFVGP